MNRIALGVLEEWAWHEQNCSGVDAYHSNERLSFLNTAVSRENVCLHKVSNTRNPETFEHIASSFHKRFLLGFGLPLDS